MMDIDRIARQIVDGEPSSDLEARIRARLDAEPPSAGRRAWPRWAMAGGVVGVATTAVTAVFLVGIREPGNPEVVSPVGVQEARGPEGVAPVGVQEFSGPEGVTPVVVRTSRDPTDTTPVLSEEERAWMDRRLPALEPADELRVEFLTYESIQPEELLIAPLIMTALPTEGVEFERRDNR